MERIEAINIWRGTYRGVPFEVNNFSLGGDPKWTFYLHIYLDQMPEDIRERFWLEPDPPMEEFKNRVFYPYNYEPLINDLAWHHGCTFYEKIMGFDGARRVVKIGCDYNHLWDQERTYTLEAVSSDARRCIDSLYELIPNIKKWCRWCGEFFVPEKDAQDRCPQCVEKAQEKEASL